MNRLAVLGQPIAHSRSPAMHTAAFRALGIADDWSYEAIELAPEEFDAGVRRLAGEGYRGANVTVPHKLAALAIAGDASPAARAIGAANTLSFGAGGGIAAENTDAPGLVAALPSAPAGARALVLGAGGAGRAAIWGLREAGAEVAVWNRTPERAEGLAGELGVAWLDASGRLPVGDFDVLVNTTAAGLEVGDDASGPIAQLKALGIDADDIGDRQVVVDLLYGSAETELVRVAREGGATVIDGLEVLVRQGAESFRIWTGLEAPLAAMRRAVRPQHDDAT